MSANLTNHARNNNKRMQALVGGWVGVVLETRVYIAIGLSYAHALIKKQFH